MQLQVEYNEDMEHLNRLRERKVLRCAIYIRVSTAEQRIDGWSLPAQEAGLKALAEARGWKVVGVYADEGKSARKRLKDRKAIHRLMEDVKAGLIDVIVFKELDRWFRNISDFYKIQDILDVYGVEWVSQQQPGLEMRTKEGRLQVNVLLSVGQNETDTTSDRIIYTNKYLVKQKRWLTGAQNLPRGHMKDEDNHVHIDPEGEPFVRTLINNVLKYGSLNRALVETNEEFPEKPMGYNNAMKLLTNPFLCGEYRGVPDFVEKPYLTREEFEELQRHIKKNARHSAQYNHFYIFSGLIICGCCGRRMTGQYTQKPNKLYRHYRCNFALRRFNCDNTNRKNEMTIEKELMSLVRNAVADMMAKVEAVEHTRAKKPKKKNNRAAIEKQLEKLEDVYIDSPTMTKEKYEQRKAAILAKLVEDEPEEKLPALADLEKVKALFEGNIEEVYATFTPEERREFWRGILSEIKIRDGKILDIKFVE